jgi:uncharacterized protein (DUF302 family)
MAQLSLGSVKLTMALPDAREAVREALGAQGFGVLSEIDMSGTLKAKLGVERPPLVILGACNPAIADRALQLDPDAGLVLPCNVALSGTAPDEVTVTITDPRALLPSGSLAEVAEEATGLLRAVLQGLAARSST